MDEGQIYSWGGRTDVSFQRCAEKKIVFLCAFLIKNQENWRNFKKMKKKFAAVILSAFMVLCVGLTMIGCSPKGAKEENKKYDVTIKVVCRERPHGETFTGPILGEWIFTPDVERMYIEREYDGKEYWYDVDSYNLPDHPRWGEEWITPNFSGPNVFDTKFLYAGHPEADRVCDKGEYVFSFYADSTSTIWNYRGVKLFITVI